MGGVFYDKIRSQFNFQSNDTEIFNVALDGETFGHHHRYGDMALAYCIDKIQSSSDVRLVNYGRFLDLYRVTTRVHIHERTSWSCAHGIERWNSNCGCRGGGDPSWTQEWRGPLRHALNILNERADAFFNTNVATFFKDPQLVLNHYIEVINNRSRDFTYIFFSRYAEKKLTDNDLIVLARNFEMKRNTQLMFTSCGWFFTELTGIETVQILMYADRVIQIYESLSEDSSVIKEFLTLLRAAKSNIPEHKDAEHIYKKWVRSNRQSLTQLAILNSMFLAVGADQDRLDKDLPRAGFRDIQHYEMGYMKTVTGTLIIESNITFSKRYFYFSLFQLSRANFLGYYNIDTEPSENPADKYRLVDAQALGEITQLLEKVKKKYKHTFSTSSLLSEYQSLILAVIAEKEQTIVETQMEDIYKRNYPLAMQYQQANLKLPLFLRNVIDFYLLENFRKTLSVNTYDYSYLERIIKDIMKWEVSLEEEKDRIKLLASYLFKSELAKIKGQLNLESLLEELLQLISILNPLNLEMDLWDSQNTFLILLKENKSYYLESKSKMPTVYVRLKTIADFVNIDLEYVLQH